MDLQAQDERMLSAHLETCESCAKFHHQIQQVLLAADDVQLPDDLTPPQPEALARAIMEDLPEQKASPFAMFGNMFKGKEKSAGKADKQPAMQGGGAVRGKKDTLAPMDMEPAGSRYPHRSQPQNVTTQPFEDTVPPQMAPPQSKGKPPEDHSGTATRLKAIAKGMSEPLGDSREAQSTTRSLGEKFGMAGPNQLTDDQPLTLAESIRRKIAESQRATGEHEPIDVQDELGPDVSGMPQQDDGQNWMKPPGLPNRQPMNGPTGLPGQSNPNLPVPGLPMQSSQNIPMPGMGSMPGMPQMPPPMPAPNAQDSGPQLAGNWGKPASPQQEASNWGGPAGSAPAGGPPQMPGGMPGGVPAMPGFPKAPQPGDAPKSAGAWGEPNWAGGEAPKGANGGDADWGPPPQGGAWDDPNDSQSAQFAPPTQPPAFGKPMGQGGLQTPAGAANAPNLDSPDQPWNKPIQAPQAAAPAAPGNAWGAPAPGPDNWASNNQNAWGQPGGQPPAQVPEPPQQAAPAQENNPWPAPAASNSAWGGPGNDWQQPQPGGNSAPVPDSWATPPQPGGAWGQPGVDANSGANAAVQAPPQQPAPEQAPQAAGAWGNQGNSGTAWGQVGQKPGDSWGTPGGAQPGGGWGAPGGGNAWGSEPSQGPAPMQPPAPTPEPVAQPAAAAKGSAWSVDAEQIETGTWRAFTPGSDSLVSNAPAAPKGWGPTPAPQAPAMPPPPAPPTGDQNRWDVPIQDRGAAQPAADAGQNRWDTPIQDRGNTQENQAPAPAANNPWGVPAAAPPLPGPSMGGFGAGPTPQSAQAAPMPQAPGVAGTGIPKDSIMDRLSNVLQGEGQPAAPQASSEESRWDMPIQERMKQDAMAASGSQAAIPAPAQAPAAKLSDNRWDTPIQDRSQQSQAPELSAPPPRWDVPIQERTQQLTPTSATPPGEQLAPQPAANPWGAPPPAPAAAAPATPAPPAMPFGSPGDQGITASSWDLPVVEAQDQLHRHPQADAMPEPPQPLGAPPQQPGGGSPSRLNINPPAFTPGNVVKQPVPMAPPAPAGAAGALFNVDDSEIDKIFSEHLGINEGAAPAGAQPAPAQPAGPPQPAIMKSLPIAPPEAPAAAGWGQPFGAPPLPGQSVDTTAQPFAAQAPQPQVQPYAAPEPQPFTAQIPEQPQFAAPAPMPFASPAPEPAPAPMPFGAPPPGNQPMQPFGAPPPAAPMPFGAPPQAPFAAPEPPQAAPMQPFGAPPPVPFAPPEAAPQPFAPAASAQPFGAPPASGAAPAAQPNPFAMPSTTQPKIVPVMSKNVATASGGPPAQGWGAPSSSGGFPATVPANGPAPSAPFGAPAAAAPAVPENKSNGLFNLDDSAMDDLFSKNLGVQEMARPVGGTGEQPVPAVMQNIPNGPPQQIPQQMAQPFAQPPQQAQAPVPFGAPPSAPMPFGAPPQAPNSAPAPFAPPVDQYSQQQAPQPFAQPPMQPSAPQPFGAPFGQQPPQAPQAPQGFAPPGAPPQGQQQGGLFNVDDGMMNKIFADNLGVQDQDPNQRVNVAAAVQALSDVAGQEAPAMPPPKIEGLGRLDAKPDTGGDTGSGRIASIGKFLLDQKDLEKIGKLTASDLSDTKMKILTLEAASEIQGLLHHIGGTPDVVGSIIIGHDGLLIANTMPQDVEADSIGIWALAVYMNTETAIKKIGHNRVHQVVARTPRGFLVIADFGGGLLVTLSDGRDTDALIPLMRSITQVVSN